MAETIIQKIKYFVIFAVIFVVQGKYYRDFKQFTEHEILNYTIYVGMCDRVLFEPHSLGLSRSFSLLPRFYLFYYDLGCFSHLNLFREIENDTDQFSEIWPKLTSFGGYQVLSENKRLGDEVVAINNSPEIIFLNDFVAGIYEYKNTSDQDILKSINRFGAKLGTKMLYEEFLTKLIRQNSNGTKPFIIVVEITNPNIYDYNSFAIYFDAVFENLLEKASTFKFKLDLIVDMEINIENIMASYNYSDLNGARYAVILINFLYRWGEERKCKVVFGANNATSPSYAKKFELIRNTINGPNGKKLLNRLIFPLLLDTDNSRLKNIIRYDSYGQQFQTIDQLTTALHKFPQGLPHRKGQILTSLHYIEGYWKINGSRADENCYGFKSYWNILMNWASINGRVLLAKYDHLDGGSRDLHNMTLSREEYMIMAKVGAQKRFLANLYGSCVVLDNNVSSRPYRLNKTLAGVTFKYSKSHSSLSSKQIINLLKTIHSKYFSVEIMLSQNETVNATVVNTLLSAMYQPQNKTPSEDSNMLKYYIWLGDLDSGDNFLSKSMLSVSPIFGAHINFRAGCVFDCALLLSKLADFAENVGVVFRRDDFEDEQSLKDLLALTIAFPVEYLVVDFNLFRNFKVELKNRRDITETYNADAFYRHVIHDSDLFYKMFDTLVVYVKLMQQFLTKSGRKIRVFVRYWIPSNDHNSTLETYLRVWEYLNEVASSQGLPYFLYQAFEDEENVTRFGWWRRKTQSEGQLDSGEWVDKQDEFYNREVLQPIQGTKDVSDYRKWRGFIGKDVVVISIVGFVSLALFVVALIWSILKLKSQV